MPELLSYLAAQARRRPLDTARFIGGELRRRGRFRLIIPKENSLPPLAGRSVAERFSCFRPGGEMDPALFRREFPGAEARIREEAERVCHRTIEIFGERVSFYGSFDWHTDWSTAHRWPLAPASRIRIPRAPAGTDIKRPWELARLHHLLPLAQAHALTGESHYAAEFCAQVLDWIECNPYPLGIHWAMPMEAAIRAMNLAAAAAWFAHSPACEPAFWEKLLASLFFHGRHIYAHREWNPVARGNHYLSCVAGLCCLGALFADTAEGNRWLRFGRRALAEELHAQVGPDGVAHEGSSGYHVFVTELFVIAALVLARSDAIPPAKSQATLKSLERACGAEFTERLRSLFDFPAALVRGRERAPVWGDADDGRVLPLCRAAADTAAHAHAIGHTLFQDDSLPRPVHRCEEAWWLLGRVPPAAHTPGRHSSQATGEAAFPSAGFYCFESRRLRGSIRCGPLGVNGWANHAHCDQLSFELCCDGRPVLVDPGTYLYSGDPAARNELRSTRAHNTPVVEAAEQNRFWPGLLFRIVDDTRSRLLRWRPEPERLECAGEHYGYQRLPQRVTVTRRLTLDRAHNSLLVLDTIAGLGSAHVEWNFHLAPVITPEQLAARAASPSPFVSEPLTGAQSDPHTGPQEMEHHSCWLLGPVKMHVWLANSSALAASLELGWVAPRYGQRVRAGVIRLTGEFALPVNIAFQFAPVTENS